MVGVLGQAVAADAGARPEHGTGDPLALEAVDACPDIVEVDPHSLAVEGRARLAAAIWRSRKVFSAVLVASAAVAVIGMILAEGQDAVVES